MRSLRLTALPAAVLAALVLTVPAAPLGALQSGSEPTDPASASEPPAPEPAAQTGAPGQQLGPVSKSTAVMLSVMGTLVPVVGGFVVAYAANAQAGGWLFLGGAVVGPSLGYFYAGRGGRGLASAAIRGGVLVGGIALASGAGEGGGAAAGLALAGVAALAVADWALLPGTVDEVNRERGVTARLQPTVDPLNRRVGLGVTVRF